MQSFFDERVEFAIQNIWINPHSGKREESLAALRDAANLGDGDAFYFLGRCYLGKSFADPVLGLPDDRKFAFECFDKSLELESAVGMFATMHIEGYEPSQGTFIHPPYKSKREIWDKVYGMAMAGEIFCQFLVANAYFYCDVADFLGITPESVGGEEMYLRRVREWAAAAVGLYEGCVERGLGIAIPNLIDILSSGKHGVPIMKKRADKYKQIGADMGIGVCERMVGNDYRDDKRFEEAVAMYERAASHGDGYAYYCLGKLFTFKGALRMDLKRAADYFEKGIAAYPNDKGLCNLLGEIRFRGGQGLACDFPKAFALLDNAYRNGSTWGSDMLGMCYLKGLGTEVDLEMARWMFELNPKKRFAVWGLEELESY